MWLICICLLEAMTSSLGDFALVVPCSSAAIAAHSQYATGELNLPIATSGKGVKQMVAAACSHCACAHNHSKKFRVEQFQRWTVSQFRCEYTWSAWYQFSKQSLHLGGGGQFQRWTLLSKDRQNQHHCRIISSKYLTKRGPKSDQQRDLTSLWYYYWQKKQRHRQLTSLLHADTTQTLQTP